MAKESSHKGPSMAWMNLMLVVLVILLASYVVWIYRDSLSQIGILHNLFSRMNNTQLQKKPSKLREGKDFYNISMASDVTGPRFTKIELDPLDPKRGEKQVITITLTDTNPAERVWINAKTDHKLQDIPLSKSESVNNQTLWKATWTVNDTILVRYVYTIQATGPGGQSATDVAMRLESP